jgi:hypothetical protein
MAKSDYDSSIKVKQEVIDRIKNMGMSAALKAAGGSETPEFKEGVTRMYGKNRISGAKDVAMSNADAKAADIASKTPVTMPKSAPAAAKRKSGKNYSPFSQKGKLAMGADISQGVHAIGKLLSGGSKKGQKTVSKEDDTSYNSNQYIG